MLPIRVREPIIGSVQQPVQVAPSTPRAVHMASGDDLTPELLDGGGVVTSFHAAADPRPLRGSPPLVAFESFTPPEGSVRTSHNPYGISPLPRIALQSIGLEHFPEGGSTQHHAPTGVSLRTSTRHTSAEVLDTPPPEGRASYSVMPLETSRPGMRRSTFAFEDTPPEEGRVSLSRQPHSLNTRTTNPPTIAFAEPPPMDQGGFALSWHAPALMRLPGVMRTVTLPTVLPDDAPAPVSFHGSPPRDASSFPRIIRPAEGLPEAGAVFAHRNRFGPGPLPARPSLALGEGPPAESGGLAYRSGRVLTALPRTITITTGESSPPEAGHSWHSHAHGLPTSHARPTLVSLVEPFELFEAATVTTFVPRITYTAPLIGTIVYLTGAGDRSIVSIDPEADCCGECQ